METAQLGDYLTVKRRGNTVTLRVQQTPQLEALLGVNNYDFADVDTSLFDKELEVNGLYGSYTKIVCGENGESDKPFVFLLTVTELGGMTFLGEQTGATTTLTQSFG